jgi:hypothetical protein
MVVLAGMAQNCTYQRFRPHREAGGDLPGLLERLRISVSQVDVGRGSGNSSKAPDLDLRRRWCLGNSAWEHSGRQRRATQAIVLVRASFGRTETEQMV